MGQILHREKRQGKPQQARCLSETASDVRCLDQSLRGVDACWPNQYQEGWDHGCTPQVSPNPKP